MSPASGASSVPQAGAVWWNEGHALHTRLFDALSLLLPVGESFLIEVVDDWRRRGVEDGRHSEGLRAEADRFVREEQSHQRAHRLYNEHVGRDAPIGPVERHIARAVEELGSLDQRSRLALAAAFEHVTAVLSREILRRGSPWLGPGASRQARLWRWHCDEELGHQQVTRDILRAEGIGALRRGGALVLAVCFLGVDMLRCLHVLCRHDVRMGRIGWAGWVRQSAWFGLRAVPGLCRMAASCLAYVVRG